MISDRPSASAARRQRASGGSEPILGAASHSPAAFLFMAIVALATGFGLMWSFPG